MTTARQRRLQFMANAHAHDVQLVERIASGPRATLPRDCLETVMEIRTASTDDDRLDAAFNAALNLGWIRPA